MKICVTGYCGFPCTCPGSYVHMDRSEAEALKQICDDHLSKLNCAEATAKYGEEMIPYQAIEVRVAAFRYGGNIHRCDHLLDNVILHKQPMGIRTISGMYTVLFDDQSNPVFIHGVDNRSNLQLSFEILEWDGEVSTSVKCDGSYIKDVYIKQINKTVYLPADME